MSNTPDERELPEVLGEDDLKRYQRILGGILSRRSMLNPVNLIWVQYCFRIKLEY